MNNTASTFDQNIEYLRSIFGDEKVNIFLRINSLDQSLKQRHKKTNFKEYKIYEDVKKCLRKIS